MKLNRLGRAAMNNPARAWLQRACVARLFADLSGKPALDAVLEVGCGGGAGVEILGRQFGPGRILAFDLDARMIARARRRLAAQPGGRVGLALADVVAIPAADASFDGVFDFGAIHLVPEWERALDEVRRVLRPGGRYFFEWVTGRMLRRLYRGVTEGFRVMDVPSPERLLAGLEQRGITVGAAVVQPRWAAMTNLVGDLIGVGRVATSGRVGPAGRELPGDRA